MANLTSQTVFFFNSRAYTRIVRDVQEWDGRTVGWVRQWGGDWVVQKATGHLWEGQNVWNVLEGVSVKELQKGR